MPRIEVTKEIHESLKKAATKRGMTLIDYVNSLIEQIGVADKDEKVILSVPTNLLRKNKDGLKQWLDLRVHALVDAYYPRKKENVDVATN
jgi:hypothetical protein